MQWDDRKARLLARLPSDTFVEPTPETKSSDAGKTTCALCGSIKSRLGVILRWHTSFTCRINVQELTIASGRGCDFCALLLRYLEEQLRPLERLQHQFRPVQTLDQSLLWKELPVNEVRVLTGGFPQSMGSSCSRDTLHKDSVMCYICGRPSASSVVDAFCLRGLSASCRCSNSCCYDCLWRLSRYIFENAHDQLSPGREPSHNEPWTFALLLTFRWSTRLDVEQIEVACLSNWVRENFVVEKIGGRVSHLASCHPLDQNFASERSISQIKEWIQHCDIKHSCVTSRRSMPTRVIDTQPAECTRSLRLNHTAGQHGQYIALSYAWGGGQPHRTISENLEERLDSGFDETQLGATIVDAISLTRKLRLRFLWIDAYCIVQDSDEDKAREIAAMAAIYSNAYLTISASVTRSSNDGFVKWKSSEPVGVGVECRLGVHSGLYRRLLGEVKIRPCVNFIINEDPLYQRAWTFQERVLSTRFLAFGSCLAWVCREDRQFDRHTGDTMENTTDENKLWATLSTDNESMWNPYLWHSIVEQFSRKSLSVETDRLPALAGLAARYSELRRNDTYVAGLWKSNICNDLLWRISRLPGTHIPFDRHRAAPTWSWGSLNAPIFFAGPGKVNNEVAMAQFIGYECPEDPQSLEGGNRFTLKLRGKIGRTRRYLYCYRGFYGEVLGTGQLEETCEEIDRRIEEGRAQTKSTRTWERYRRTTMTPRYISIDEEVDCIPWPDNASTAFSQEDMTHVTSCEVLGSRDTLLLPTITTALKQYGLLLQAHEVQGGYFRRIGMYEWSLDCYSSKPDDLASVDWSEERELILV